MLDLAAIVATALKEHALEHEPSAAAGPSTPAAPAVPDAATLTAALSAQLADPGSIPAFSRASPALSLVRFRCLLQDTGYPAEVYLPASEDEDDGAAGVTDWSKLKERWVGWAVEVPGEQPWARGEGDDGVSAASAALDRLDLAPTPAAVRAKWPLPDGGDAYLGALVKIYDDVSFAPASAHTMVGLVSVAALPAPLAADGKEAHIAVPCIHVVCPPTALSPVPPPAAAPLSPAAPAADDATRAELIDALSAAFDPPDRTAATLLLLLLISSPAVRPPALAPLGTLSLNLLRPASSSSARPPSAPSALPALPALSALLAALTPALVPLALSLPLLHAHPFAPAATDDGAGLAAGLLQLAPGTLLVVDEDAMGDGGALDARALASLDALTSAVQNQRVSYRYPYMDGLQMDAAIRALVLSEGKSILPVDVHLPVSLADAPPAVPPPQLAAFRAYLAAHGSAAHAAALAIPESTAAAIQDAFVADRQAGAAAAGAAAAAAGSLARAEDRLRRRMRIARLVALSHAGRLDADAWAETVRLDDEVERRLAERDAARMEAKLGRPAENGAERSPSA